MFKVTSSQVISFTLQLWLFSFAPFPSRVRANNEDLLAHSVSDNNHLVEHFASLLSSPFSRSYTRRGSAASSYNNSGSDINGDPSGSSLLLNEIPRLPVWNGAPNNDQRHIDLTQLFELMGEPRGSRGRELSELITRPKPKCNRRIRILNGVTRIRERGSLARFQCSHGFTLIGPTTIVCLRDRWSEPPPICVKSGCRPIRKPQNAEVRQSIGGAVVAFYCFGETKLQGDPIIFCDGIRWNGTEPTCEADSEITTPEPESEEIWPESVATPFPWNATGGNTEQEANWDTNLEQSPLEVTTEGAVVAEITNIPPIVYTTESEAVRSDEEMTIQTVHVPISTEVNPFPIDEKVTSEPVTELALPPRLPEEEMKTEKHPEIPAPITTESPPILTHQMGQSDIPLVYITSTALTTLPPPPAIHPLPQKVTTVPSPEPPPVDPVTTVQQTTTPRPSVIPVLVNATTTPIPPPALVPVTTRRRFKIITKRPRRPSYTRRPARRPLRRTTTTVKPRKPQLPTFLTLTTTTQPPPVKTLTTPISRTPQPVQDSAPSVDYPIAIDKEFLPREQVEPIRPIIFPDMLNNNVYSGGERVSNGDDTSHASMIIGIVLVVVGLSTFSAGVVFYCWRKNKGIARARPYDLDGRTLSAHDANDDFMWMDQRDSGL